MKKYETLYGVRITWRMAAEAESNTGSASRRAGPRLYAAVRCYHTISHPVQYDIIQINTRNSMRGWAMHYYHRHQASTEVYRAQSSNRWFSEYLEVSLMMD